MVGMAGPALACGGVFSANGEVNLTRTTTLAAYADGVEHYVTAFEFAGAGGAFGSIVPLPGVPTTVEEGGEWTLQRLVKEVTPQSQASAGADAVFATAAGAPGRGPARDPRRRPRPHRPQGRGRGGGRVGHRQRVPAHARRPRGPRLLRQAQPDLPGRPLRRRRRGRQGREPRRRHARAHHHPHVEPVGAAAHPRPRPGGGRAHRRRRLPAHRDQAHPPRRTGLGRASSSTARSRPPSRC